MYPFARLLWQFWRHRDDPRLGPFDPHVSRHVCLPWDLDLFGELNNGRTLTLFDLGRLPWTRRTGLWPVLRANGWSIAVAGASVRWRRRVFLFDRLVMRTRALGWDERFFYSEQSLTLASGRWTGEVASHVLIRSAATDRRGLVPPARVMAALGLAGSPPLPPWVRAWAEADGERPWPPMP